MGVGKTQFSEIRSDGEGRKGGALFLSVAECVAQSYTHARSRRRERKEMKKDEIEDAQRTAVFRKHQRLLFMFCTIGKPS